jgi:hypothetical protein
VQLLMMQFVLLGAGVMGGAWPLVLLLPMDRFLLRVLVLLLLLLLLCMAIFLVPWDVL